jgi:hypothetical protein
MPEARKGQICSRPSPRLRFPDDSAKRGRRADTSEGNAGNAGGVVYMYLCGCRGHGRPRRSHSALCRIACSRSSRAATARTRPTDPTVAAALARVRILILTQNRPIMGVDNEGLLCMREVLRERPHDDAGVSHLQSRRPTTVVTVVTNGPRPLEVFLSSGHFCRKTCSIDAEVHD